MARYQLVEEDVVYAHEFLAKPFGYHSPGLQRVLNLLRGQGPKGKFVLVCDEPYRRWTLARLPAARGEPLEHVPGVAYSSLAEAERDVFVRRWQEHGGPQLGIAGGGAREC